jgi:nucleoside-diphosphate-sugar epimerase
MHIVLTGGNGFIGRMLLKKMKTHPVFSDPSHKITLIGRRFETEIDDPRVRTVIGNLTDPEIVAEAFDPAPDVVIHLAALGSAESETDFDLGMEVNLHGTLGLLDALRHRGIKSRFVFSSSIAVYGGPLPSPVTDETPAVPGISYGAEKLAMEVLLRDYTRRGWVEGVALRLSGIFARPPMRTTAGSAFWSDFLRSLAEGQPYVLPVSADARVWAMSWQTCVDNLFHAALMPRGTAGERTTYMLPALHVSVGEMLDALAELYGPQVRDLVSYDVNERTQAIFGSYPPLALKAAEADGFVGDGDAVTLVRRSLEGIVPAA